MSLSILKNDFFDLLQKAFPIIPLKSSLQILSNFRFSFDGESFNISATDLDHFIRVYKKVDGEDSFEIAVNARKIFEIVREIPDGLVYLDLKENVFFIRSEKGFSCRIACTDIHDFPGFPDIGDIQPYQVSSIILKDLIIKSSFASAKDESRAVLCGVFFEIIGNKIGMVATDGHRLGCSFNSVSTSSDSSNNCVISTKSLLNLSRIFDNKKDEIVNIQIGEKYISFFTSNVIMYSKLLEGPYPDYSKVIPKNNPKNAIIDRNLLQLSVKRVSVLANQKTHLIKFLFSKNILEIVVSNNEIGGEARDKISIFYENDDTAIGFNSHYLLEILEIIKTDKIRIEMNTQISACLIFPVHEKEETRTSEDLFLIMPLRILDDIF